MNILISVKMDIYIDDTMFGVYMFVDPSGRCWSMLGRCWVDVGSILICKTRKE